MEDFPPSRDDPHRRAGGLPHGPPEEMFVSTPGDRNRALLMALASPRADQDEPGRGTGAPGAGQPRLGIMRHQRLMRRSFGDTDNRSRSMRQFVQLSGRSRTRMAGCTNCGKPRREDRHAHRVRDYSNCGAFIVHLDGIGKRDDSVLAVQGRAADHHDQGLAKRRVAPLQKAVPQRATLCAVRIRTPDMIMDDAGNLLRRPGPSDQEIREGLEGNL